MVLYKIGPVSGLGGCSTWRLGTNGGSPQLHMYKALLFANRPQTGKSQQFRQASGVPFKRSLVPI